MNLPWAWGSKISENLLLAGLQSVAHLFAGNVLDIGCGSKPYESIAGTGVSNWIGLDLATTPSGDSAADVYGSALSLPFGSCTFDTIVSTQVLEHVTQPEALLREAYRVLRPGGHLVLTAPQTNPLHEEPNDFFRFTCHGLKLLTRRAGFDGVQTEPLGGAIATVGQMIVWHLNWLRRVPLIGHLLCKIGSAALAWLVLKLDRLSSVYGGGAMKDTLNWLVVARKPKPC